VKYYPQKNPPYHYINNNYVGGMRFSYHRADLAYKSSPYPSAILESRRTNYKGSTNSSNFDRIEKDPFGRDQIKYSNSGGYYDRGGYIIYFESDWDLDKALSYYQNLTEDGIFDKQFIALTMEVNFSV